MADKKISALTASATPLAGTEVLPIVQSGSTVKVAVSNLTAGRSVGMQQANIAAAAGGGFVNPAFIADDGTGAARIVFLGASYAGVPANKPWLHSYQDIYVGSDAGTTFNVISGGTKTLGVDGSGNATVTGNFVPATAGKGIDFSANTHAAGMTSELLNWYEEGTFTPTFTGLTVGNGSVFGYYRRIGKQVFVTYGFITGSTSVVAALTGVSGFPFTTGTVGGSRFFPVTGVAFEGGVGWYGAASAIFSAATSGIGVFSPTNDVGFSAAVPFVWGTDDSLSLTATYFVD